MTPFLLMGAAMVGCLMGFWLGRSTLGSAETGAKTPEAGPVSTSGPAGPVATAHTRNEMNIERALADLRLGVVVIDEDGAEVYRNNLAKQYATGRHGDALVEAALERVFEGALRGLSLVESVEVYGPPARTVLVQASPTFDLGALSGAVGVMDDVTEARNVDRMRSDFVANVSHELRTPVGAMSVLAETIAGSDDPEVVDRLAGRMQREANRLSNTIDDLMALSRLESGPVTDPETLDLVSVTTMAIERTGEAAQQRHVRITVENGHGGPILIDGDEGQMVSAVANLIDNAIKYSDHGGDVVVFLDIPGVPDPDTGCSNQDGSGAAGSLAELSVIDSGIGIPDRDLSRIFERFYRVDSARRRENGGTGLGLSIVRHALLNHGATIDVESIEGQGSRFTMRVPVSGAQTPLSSCRTGPAGSTVATESAGDRASRQNTAATEGVDKWTT